MSLKYMKINPASLGEMVYTGEFVLIDKFGSPIVKNNNNSFNRNNEQKKAGTRYKLQRFFGNGKPVVIDVYTGSKTVALNVGDKVSFKNVYAQVSSTRTSDARVLTKLVLSAETDDMLVVK